MRTLLLRQLDRIFPPNRAAYMTADEQTAYEQAKASKTMVRYLMELGRGETRDVLDFGCGWGGETLAIAPEVRSIIGVDVDPANLAQAERARQRLHVSNCRFVHGTESLPDACVDGVFSTDTFEHVQDLPYAFRELYRVLRPGGKLIASWGPLFYSPQGYHLYWTTQVPYAHLLFGLRPILQLRNERAEQPITAQTWADMGLNGRTYEEYRAAANDAGFDLHRFARVPVRGLNRLAQLPGLSRLLTFGINAYLIKA
jgi:SAM-dependent methyltransferase